MKKLITILIGICLVFSACLFTACSSKEKESKKKELTVIEMIDLAVKDADARKRCLANIGGEDFVKSDIKIDNRKQINDECYEVSGRVTWTDEHGTKWINEFECEVKQYSSKKWEATNFRYLNDSWTRVW